MCDFRWLIGRTQIELAQNVTSFHSPQFEITQILDWKGKPINSPRSGNHISRCPKILTIQGNPTIIFCKIAVRRSKYCLEFYITWGRLNSPRSGNHISRCPKILTIQGNPTIIFCKIAVRRSKYCLEFYITWGRLKISYKIRNLKFSDSKMWWREEPEKF